MNRRRFNQLVFTTASGLAALAMLVSLAIASTRIDIPGPPGSESFGTSVTMLPNGNLVICDPYYDAPGAADVGAVYLYDGESGALISQLTGSAAGDQVCFQSITVLTNGNYLINSSWWDNGSAVDAGAVTWASGVTGVNGVVNPANSLVGGHAGDQVGLSKPLSNGNYLVSSPYWDNGPAVDAGAITWGDGETGVSGTVSAANSLVGSSANDQIGNLYLYNVIELANGNYLVLSPYWDNGPAADAGAVTWGSGATGITGLVSAANSLVGGSQDDQVGAYFRGGTFELSNGNYLMLSPYWDNGPAADAGAVTWGSAAAGITGLVSAANSLVGGSTGDQVGSDGILILANGNYLVRSSNWDNGPAEDAGAVTWGSATTGITGLVSAANSLVGGSLDDQLGAYYRGGIFALSNGNYVVGSPLWDDGPAIDVGAVTWSSGSSGISGPVSAANSLVGSAAGDHVGKYPLIELATGNYLVTSLDWDNGPAVDAGAITCGSGTSGVVGRVSAANSLVGSSTGDHIGDRGVWSVGDGNYLVLSPYWDNGPAVDAGAVTWVDGETGFTGPVSAANSLVGSTTGDQVSGVTTLANGNYVVGSPYWDNGAAADAGAVTWGDARTGITGPVSAANSLVGSTAGDRVGDLVWELTNGNYVVGSPYWDSGAAADAGAVTWGYGTAGITGTISSANSLVGSSPGDRVGSGSILDLSNGNYVVSSPYWDNGAVPDVGAVTWGDGATGTRGTLSAANSLVGSSIDDRIGEDYRTIIMLSNGNYLVNSPNWDNGAAVDAGAVTWGNGMAGVTGPISAANSLVGTTAYDQVGSKTGLAGGRYLVFVLANGNYVVASPFWDNGTIPDAGAITWGSGSTGISGPVSAANSLVGSTAEDSIGYGLEGDRLKVTLLDNGNYVVASPHWDNGTIVDAGAVTWGSGTTGISGPVSPDDSLVGSAENDLVGISAAIELSNGDYLVDSPSWDNGAEVDAGAVTWGRGATGLHGPITDQNSVLGTNPNNLDFYDPVNDQLVIGLARQNKVTLFRLNRSPVAEAGKPQSVERGALVRLDGSASYDPDGNLPLQFEWTQTGGPPVSLSNPQAVSPTFTAPDERTSLTFNLVVTDALGSSSRPSKAIVFVDPYQYFWPLMPEH